MMSLLSIKACELRQRAPADLPRRCGGVKARKHKGSERDRRCEQGEAGGRALGLGNETERERSQHPELWKEEGEANSGGQRRRLKWTRQKVKTECQEVSQMDGGKGDGWQDAGQKQGGRKVDLEGERRSQREKVKGNGYDAAKNKTGWGRKGAFPLLLQI